jgi:hypothetical protein
MILNIEKDPKTGNQILILPQKLTEDTGWQEGETLIWKVSPTGEVTLSKVERKDLVNLLVYFAKLIE